MVGVKYDIKGNGYVVTQSCPYDTPVSKDLVVTLQLEDRLTPKVEEPVEEPTEEENEEEVYEE